MSFDALITNPGRLRILTALVSDPRQEFVQLRGATRMTDGNLTTHARRLHSAGYVEIDKAFRDGKPVTTISLTRQGREALQSHVEDLMQAIHPQQTASTDVAEETQNLAVAAAPIYSTPDDSDWID